MMQPIILAAGKGSRMQSELPKTLVPLLGVPMLVRIVRTLENTTDARPPLIVVGHKAEMVRDTMGDAYRYVHMPELTGTATAVSVCIPHLAEGTDPVLVVYGDQPLVSAGTLNRLYETFRDERAVLAVATNTVPDFEDWRSIFMGHGRILRDATGNICGIVEYKNATDKERAIRELNTAFYCFDRGWLLENLPKVAPNPLTGEYYLTDLVAIATNQGDKVVSVTIPPEEAVGVNSPEEAAHAERILSGNL